MYSKKIMFKKLGLFLVVLMTVTLLLPMVTAGVAGAADSPANSAVHFLRNDYAKNGINNSEAGVGSYALYVLNRAGVDVSTWVYDNVNLEDAVISAVSGDIPNASDPSKVSAKLLAQELVATKVLGRDDLAVQLVQILKNRQSSTGFDTGDYSLFSNMPAFDLLGRAGSSSVINTVYAKDYILSQQLTVNKEVYGSWGGSWTDDQGTHYFADFMATAQAVRALHYLNTENNDASVQAAIYSGLDWMKNQQQDDGSFVTG